MKNYIFFLIITLAIEFTAALVATIHKKKYKNSKEKYFLHFLWFTFLVDFFASVIVAYCFKMDSYFMYNIYKIITFSFLLYWYYTIIKNNKIIIILGFIYTISLLISFWYEPFFSSVQKINFATGAILLIVSSLLYFAETLKSDKVLNISKSLPFWITMGNLLFFIGVIPLILLLDYLKIEDLSFNIVLLILNIILYSSYIIGFIWMKKK